MNNEARTSVVVVSALPPDALTPRRDLAGGRYRAEAYPSDPTAVLAESLGYASAR